MSPHSIIQSPFSKYSSPPMSKKSSAPFNLYTSKWKIVIFSFWYSLTIVNVGLEISSANPKYSNIPCVNFVFPAPSSPFKTIISFLLSVSANFFANWIVSVSFFDMYV